jgi:predicted nucleic acid-binding Zn ribbon protein
MRRASGFVPTRACVLETMARVLARQPLSPAKVAFAWQIVVGPALARVTAVDLDERARGTLLVRSDDPRWTTELERSRDVIVRRLAALLGSGVVREVICVNR